MFGIRLAIGRETCVDTPFKRHAQLVKDNAYRAKIKYHCTCGKLRVTRFKYNFIVGSMNGRESITRTTMRLENDYRTAIRFAKFRYSNS